METKKSPRVNLENRKRIFREIGLIIALLSVFMLFEYSIHPKDVMVSTADASSFMEDLMPHTVAEKEPPKEKITKPLPEKKVIDPVITVTDKKEHDQSDMLIDYGLLNGLDTLSFDKKADKNESAYRFSEKRPQFPGGYKALMEFVDKNTKLTPELLELGISGRVVVKFIVDKSGKVLKPVILEAPTKFHEKSVLEMISQMPDFIPGEQGGEKVSVYVNLPVEFEIKN
ncbi:MAG: TonB family protein [Bacteroidales bacterium]|jgi:protein TonB|nr:TonB family protein [Bacteroidales bacterium]